MKHKMNEKVKRRIFFTSRLIAESLLHETFQIIFIGNIKYSVMFNLTFTVRLFINLSINFIF